MKSIKLYKYNFRINKSVINLLPVITLVFNDFIYRERNFAIQFHWLIFNARLLWLKQE